jgi:hypothetical protein
MLWADAGFDDLTTVVIEMQVIKPPSAAIEFRLSFPFSFA